MYRVRRERDGNYETTKVLFPTFFIPLAHCAELSRPSTREGHVAVVVVEIDQCVGVEAELHEVEQQLSHLIAAIRTAIDDEFCTGQSAF